MKIGNSVDWDFDISVVSKVGRGNNVGVDSDFNAEVGNGDGEVIELEFLYEVVSDYKSSVNKVVKDVIGRVSLGVGESIGWFVDSGVGS